MTTNLTRSSRLSIFVMALAYTGLTFGAATAPSPAAAQAGGYYIASLAQPSEDSRVVAGGVAWLCEGTTCIANKGTSRPVRVCRGLARKIGEITGFSTKGETLAQDQLAECNGR